MREVVEEKVGVRVKYMKVERERESTELEIK